MFFGVNGEWNLTPSAAEKTLKCFRESFGFMKTEISVTTAETVFRNYELTSSRDGPTQTPLSPEMSAASLEKVLISAVIVKQLLQT